MVNFKLIFKKTQFIDTKHTSSTREFVHSSWNQAVANHINTRSQKVNNSLTVSTPIKSQRFGRKKFKIYAKENMLMEVINDDNKHLKSIYTIDHVKEKRKKSLIMCKYCGNESMGDRRI